MRLMLLLLDLLHLVASLWMVPTEWLVRRFGHDDDGNVTFVGLVLMMPALVLSVIASFTFAFLVCGTILVIVAFMFYLPFCVFIDETCP